MTINFLINGCIGLLVEFKATQKRKERNNIDIAYYKIGKGAPLNRYDKKALKAFENYLTSTFSEEVSK